MLVAMLSKSLLKNRYNPVFSVRFGPAARGTTAAANSR
jgi:hypothetical protein